MLLAGNKLSLSLTSELIVAFFIKSCTQCLYEDSNIVFKKA